MDRKYYEAYDDRYRQVHGQNLQWFDDRPSPIVKDVLQRYNIEGRILEIGCGEGRDAGYLLMQGWDVLATDISPAAIAYARKRFPEFEHHFQTLDCLGQVLAEKFSFIYAVAVVHMLVPDQDREGFYRFIHDHLAAGGMALICTMGNGEWERQSDISRAFDLQTRIHEPTGREVCVAGTSCRIVSWDTFRKELAENDLAIVEDGLTAVEPDFPQMMYALVKKGKI